MYHATSPLLSTISSQILLKRFFSPVSLTLGFLITTHKLFFCTRNMKRVKFHKGTFKKYVRSRFPSFDPPPPLFALFRFRAPPPPKVHSFWLELTLSPSISILEKFREKKLITSTIVSLVELNVSFKKP